MGDKEWNRSGSFVKKPTTGWLHDDRALSVGDGVYYPVKYVGSIPLQKSMRELRFEDRTVVTREAITLVSEMAGIRKPKKRKVSRVVKQCLVDDPVLKNHNVKLTISTSGIAIVIIETNQVIANHIMPCISFATGGDAVDYDIIGYVAKDARNFREVHVFDCGHMAQDVIATMGQAFELRYKAFLKKGAQQMGGGMGPGGTGTMGTRNPLFDALPQTPGSRPAPQPLYGDAVYDQAAGGGQESFYDDLPAATGGYGGGTYGEASYGEVGAPTASAIPVYGDEAVYDNGTVLNTGAGAGSVYGDQGNYGDHGNYGDAGNYGDHGAGMSIYDNAASSTQPSTAAPRILSEPDYDMAGAGGAPKPDFDDDVKFSGSAPPAGGGAELEKPLTQEVWFHGRLGRDAADQQLRNEGDFLVRESPHSPGQYVLSALQDGDCKNLLLVDPSGVVRTKDMTFDSVSHLINYHLSARIPIISRGSRISLGAPVFPQAYGYNSYNSLPGQ